MTRVRCSVFIAQSLDGYIARRDGTIDWLEIVASQGEDYGFAAFYATVDVLVMGRTTFDTALGFGAWPYAGKRVIVLTHRPGESRHGEEYFGGAPRELVRRLEAEGARRVYVDGGSVIRQFLAEDLLDDLTISILPIVLGDGLPLFGHGTGEHRLALAGVQHWPTGLVQLRYEKSRR